MLEKSDVEGVLRNTPGLTGCDVKVKVSGTKLTLSGRVNSPDQKSEAEQIAWKAVGVWSVNNELSIN